MTDHETQCRCPACQPTPFDLFMEGATALVCAIALASVVFALGCGWLR